MSTGKKVSVAVGAGVGGVLGSSIGIAGFFGAVSGALPVALLGAYLGHKAHQKLSNTTAAREFNEGASAAYEARMAELRKAHMRVQAQMRADQRRNDKRDK
jgi:hypothetical protein